MPAEQQQLLNPPPSVVTAREGATPPLATAGTAVLLFGGALLFFPLSHAPFADAKLLAVVAGTLLVWLARPVPDHKTTILVSAWVVALLVAALAGPDPVHSLLGEETRDNGLLLLACSGCLLAVSGGLPAFLVPRLRTWLVAIGLLVSGVEILGRLAPKAVSVVFPGLSLAGSTLGQVAFTGAVIGVSLIAAIGHPGLRGAKLMLAVIGLSSGLSLTAERGAWIALVIGAAVAMRRKSVPMRRTGAVLALVAATSVVWLGIGAVTRQARPLSPAARFKTLGEESMRFRGTVLRVGIQAWTKRPITGWGPANTAGAYLASATPNQARRAGRGWSDMHNLAVEALVSTGALGSIALLVLLGHSSRLASKAPAELGWAAGAAAALGFHHLINPVNVFVTPLFFLLLGIAAIPPAPLSVEQEPVPRPSRFRWLAGIALLAGLAASTARFAASALEQYGHQYGSGWAIRKSLRLEPRRFSSAQDLALFLAFDGRTGNKEAASEARRVASKNVDWHPWLPNSRLVASDVEVLLRNPQGACPWIAAQINRFPADLVFLAGHNPCPSLPRSTLP